MAWGGAVIRAATGEQTRRRCVRVRIRRGAWPPHGGPPGRRQRREVFVHTGAGSRSACEELLAGPHVVVHHREETGVNGAARAGDERVSRGGAGGSITGEKCHHRRERSRCEGCHSAERPLHTHRCRPPRLLQAADARPLLTRRRRRSCQQLRHRHEWASWLPSPPPPPRLEAHAWPPRHPAGALARKETVAQPRPPADRWPVARRRPAPPRTRADDRMRRQLGAPAARRQRRRQRSETRLPGAGRDD
eukprot:scaffold18987_cov109-Isochrysis_galbana.AAC.12